MMGMGWSTKNNHNDLKTNNARPRSVTPKNALHTDTTLLPRAPKKRPHTRVLDDEQKRELQESGIVRQLVF